MAFLLSSQNVFQYLTEQRIWSLQPNPPSQVKPKGGKNFNLLVSFSEGYHFLVKQERHDLEGKTDGEFWHEWAIHEFLNLFPELGFLCSFISEIVHFDPDRSILVLDYLDDYCDLTDFYHQECTFPAEIAASVGTMLATIHRTILDRQDYKDFFSQKKWDKVCVESIPSIFHGLSRVSSEVFGMVRTNCLDFFRLYQRDEHLGQAIAQLKDAWEPCCLIHNDLRLCNFLLHLDWESIQAQAKPGNPNIIRLIDWEKFTWGDPAFDLGTVIAGYLGIWLDSLIINPEIGIDTALRLAATPLEHLQPSLIAFIRAYFESFPALHERRPNVMAYVMQFAGVVLIRKILVKLDHRSAFGNTEICMLHVAKTLLCDPEKSIPTIFGVTSSELFPVGVRL
jgi:Phosphotransferase enzyme family